LEYKEYEKMEQNEIVEQILEMCVDESRKRVLRGQVDLNNIVFTLDNVMKLILIYLRIRANMPVLLMGETGVGKTSLIEYLGKIIDAECLTLNVHAGITEDEIINHVLLA
jgi:midasin (ATPase involved in ribosome maturation)